MRPVASHLLVALVALGVGYAAAHELAGFLALDPGRDLPGSRTTPPAATALGLEVCEPYRADVIELRSQVEELNAKLRAAEKVRALYELLPLSPPPDLDERFEAAALLEAFRRAAAEPAFDVEIASVDCTEYPCIIYGHTVDDEAALETFLDAAAGQTYGEGATRFHYSWGQTRLPEVAGPRRYFGVALYPALDATARGELIRRRLRFRSQQMWDAVRGESR